MEIDAKCATTADDDWARYTYRYYVPKSVRASILPKDVQLIESALRERFPDSRDFASDVLEAKPEDCTIRYGLDQVKTVSKELYEAVLQASAAHWQDRWDRDFIAHENEFLSALNLRLRQLEEEISAKVANCKAALIGKMLGDKLPTDFELNVRICFYLNEEDPWAEEGDDNILYELKDVDKERWEEKEENSTRVGRYKLPVYSGDEEEPRDQCSDRCRLFNDLVLDSPVPIKHLNRIGRIRAGIEITPKGFLEIKRQSEENWTVVDSVERPLS